MNYKKKEIIFFSREFIYESSDGSSAYVFDLLQYLHKCDFDIYYVILKRDGNRYCPFYLIPTNVLKICKVSSEKSKLIGKLLIDNNIRNFLTFPFWYFYQFFPVIIKEVYRKIKSKYIESIVQNSPKQLPTVESPIALSDSEKKFVNECINKYSPDAIIVNFAWLGGIFDEIKISSRTKKIIITHEILHQRYEALQKIGVRLEEDQIGWTWKFESNVLQKADILVAIQNEDAKTLQLMSPKNIVLNIPKAANVKKVQSNSINGRCIFVGSHAEQNIIGITWFIDKVWPIVINEIPYADLHIFGTVCESINGGLKNISLRGKVKNLDVEYAFANVCVIPLLVGSGLKIKLIEAIAYGKAIVTTSIGIQGLNEIEKFDQPYLVADDPEEFASSIIKIITDSSFCHKLELNSYNLAVNKFSEYSCYHPLVNCLK